MPLIMEAKVYPKRRDNSPTPGGDILEDIINYSIVVEIAAFGAMCSLHQDCSTMGNSHCKSDACECRDGFLVSSNGTACLPSKYLDKHMYNINVTIPTNKAMQCAIHKYNK
jgi:hypothetical protein